METTRYSVMESLLKYGLSRRGFLKFCAIAASTLALPPVEARNIAGALARIARPRVVWLHFQECTACTEALTRGFDPALEDLLLEIISLEYHETLMAAAGHEAETLLRDATASKGYVLVIEGSASTKNGWCEIGGHDSIDTLKENGLAKRAALVIAVGSCAAYGGLPAAFPNPSDAISVGELVDSGELEVKALVNLPGCPPVPEVMTGTLVHFLAYGKPPELDELRRPLAFYGRTVHHRCPRKAAYNAGRFAETFDDIGAREGWCLLHLGCKGPVTHNACSVVGWNQGTSMPMHSGHGCIGCSEPDFWDRWDAHGGVYGALRSSKRRGIGRRSQRKERLMRPGQTDRPTESG